jgi:hypothetical protein
MAFDSWLFGALSLGVLILAAVLAGNFSVERGSKHSWRRLSLLRVRAGGGSRFPDRFRPGRTHSGIGRYPNRRHH